MSPDDIILGLGRIFEERLRLRVPELDSDLFDSGTLDSLAFVDLVAALETEFGIQVDLLEMDLDDFRTLRSISAFVAGRRG